MTHSPLLLCGHFSIGEKGAYLFWVDAFLNGVDGQANRAVAWTRSAPLGDRCEKKQTIYGRPNRTDICVANRLIRNALTAVKVSGGHGLKEFRV